MSTLRNTAALGAAGILLAGALLVAPRPSRANGAPVHLEWAEQLVATIQPANNQYGSPAFIQWQGIDGPVSKNKSVCSSFFTTLVRRVYGLSEEEIKSWAGRKSPYAEEWHHEVVAEDGFERVTEVVDIAPGDMIAVDYREESSSSSGHVALASSTPIDRGLMTKSGTQVRAYDLMVIDSSQSYHGTADTRYLRKDGSVPDNGVGEGTMRVYADPITGAIAGHSWSTSNGSTFYRQPAEDLAGAGRHLVVGRLAIEE